MYIHVSWHDLLSSARMLELNTIKCFKQLQAARSHKHVTKILFNVEKIPDQVVTCQQTACSL